MTEIDRAIAYFDGYGSPYDDLVITALREKQEREQNEPLSLGELRQMDGQPVWCEHMKEWRIVIADHANRIIKLYSVFNTISAQHVINNDGGIYRRPPKEG